MEWRKGEETMADGRDQSSLKGRGKAAGLVQMDILDFGV